MRVKGTENSLVSSVYARELGCWSLFQVSALGVIDLLKSGRSSTAIEIGHDSSMSVPPVSLRDRRPHCNWLKQFQIAEYERLGKRA